MNTVKELKAERDAFWDSFYERMEAAMKKEFPVGTRVAWMHGLNRQTGHIERIAYSTSVWVKNERPGGGSKKVDVTELERIEATVGGQTDG